MSRDVVILSGVRTAVGTYGGTLKGQSPTELAALCVREAVQRAGIASADVGHCVFGNVIHTEAKDMYLGRVAAINGGLPVGQVGFKKLQGNRGTCAGRARRQPQGPAAIGEGLATVDGRVKQGTEGWVAFVGCQDQCGCLPAHQAGSKKGLFKRIVTPGSGNIGPGSTVMQGDLSGRCIVHRADKVGGTGKPLIGGEMAF